MSDVTLAAPFNEGLACNELRYQICCDCQTAQTLARYACRVCGSSNLEWRTASGLGTIYAVTMVSRAPADEFRALLPYTLVIVELDEGPRLMGHASAGVAIGERVEAEFFMLGERKLVRFRPQ
jgi:uncharacterized OB-fold protein